MLFAGASASFFSVKWQTRDIAYFSLPRKSRFLNQHPAKAPSPLLGRRCENVHYQPFILVCSLFSVSCNLKQLFINHVLHICVVTLRPVLVSVIVPLLIKTISSVIDESIVSFRCNVGLGPLLHCAWVKLRQLTLWQCSFFLCSADKHRS